MFEERFFRTECRPQASICLPHHPAPHMNYLSVHAPHVRSRNHNSDNLENVKVSTQIFNFHDFTCLWSGFYGTHLGSSGLEMVTSGAPESGSDFLTVVVLFGVPRGVWNFWRNFKLELLNLWSGFGQNRAKWAAHRSGQDLLMVVSQTYVCPPARVKFSAESKPRAGFPGKTVHPFTFS